MISNTKFRAYVFLVAMYLMVVPGMAQTSLTYRSGDVNGDGMVDVADIASVISIMSGDFSDKLKLASSSIGLMTGYGGVIPIVEGTGNYSAESNNPEIATASVGQQKDSNGQLKEGMFAVYIYAQTAGEVNITVTDNVTSLAETIKVTVTDNPNPITGGSYVDLGLASGTLWGTCNVGADTPEDYGWYVAWGETSEKEQYSTDNYLRSSFESSSLPDVFDVACVTMGDHWRMPKIEELEELLSCTWSWEEHSGVKGARVTGPNGNAIFLPAASFKFTRLDSNYPPEIGTYGSYWSRDADGSYGAELVFGTLHHLLWIETNFYWDMGTTGVRTHGRSVRPVYDMSYISDIPESPKKDGEDYTSYITNPRYDNNDTNGWEGTPLGFVNPDNNAEHYSKTYDTYQSISGLPKGVYRLGVQAFYRRGNYTNDYELWTNGDTENNNALLYATSSVASVSKPLVSISSGAIPAGLGVKADKVGDNLYVPFDMVAAGAWFAANYYQNYLEVKVGDDGALVIGIKKEVTISDDWTVIDNWTLYRIGD
ncbi:MAG: hypothetical protein J6W19_02625 [Prevotella sp.]|nr:hypothetical protein [Prevotella sp.]